MPEFSPALEHPKDLDATTRAYLTAIEWLHPGPEENEDPDICKSTGFAPQTIWAAKRDCAEFRAAANAWLGGLNDSQIGLDLWLTRNRHGAGFWDRGLGAAGNILTRLAHDMGSLDSYTGDDGLIYLSGRECEQPA